jgi:hypothetical protein
LVLSRFRGVVARDTDVIAEVEFQRATATLDDRVVIAVAPAAHAAAHPMARQFALSGGAGVLASALGMVEARWAAAAPERAVPRREHERRLERVVGGSADDPPRIQVGEHRQVEPPSAVAMAVMSAAQIALGLGAVNACARRLGATRLRRIRTRPKAVPLKYGS